MPLKQLKEVPGLAERMAVLMCVDLDRESDITVELEEELDDDNERRNKILDILEREMEKVKERSSDSAAWLELEEFGIDDDMLAALRLSSRFPNLDALNLRGNKLQNSEKKIVLVAANAIQEGILSLEIYSSCFTKNSAVWALGFSGSVVGMDNLGFKIDSASTLEGITSLDLSDRCIHNLPKAFSPAVMPSISRLNLKGNPLGGVSLDDLLNLLSVFTCLYDLEVDIPGALGNNALRILNYLPNLSSFNGITASSIFECGKQVVDSSLKPRFPDWTYFQSLVDRVIGAMRLYLMTYRLAVEEKIDETSA